MWLSGPYRRENSHPLPIRLEDPALLYQQMGTIRTSALAGPDRLERGSVLELEVRKVSLDVSSVPDLGNLTERLHVIRHNWQLIHPDEKYPGRLILLCDREVSGQRLALVLGAALSTGVMETDLTFPRQEVLHRPILGRLTRVHASAARTRLAHGQTCDGSDGDAHHGRCPKQL